MMSGHSRLRAVGVLAVTALFATTACGAAATGSDAPAEGTPQVLAAFYPLQWLTEQVGGPDVTVTSLTAAGVEPHDLELGVPQMAQLEDATLTVYIKGVQPAVDEAVTPDRAFDAATAIATLPSGAPAGGHAEGEAGHEVPYDTHLWLDPARFATVATELGERLAAADPAHAQAYKERAGRTATSLSTLDQDFARGLADCSTKTMVTAHEAFGYLADRYQLKQVGITLDPETEPSPARIAEVARLAKAEKVTTVFTESLVSPKVAEVLASEVGARTVVLDPLESKPAGDYLSGMRSNLRTLRTALGCTS